MLSVPSGCLLFISFKLKEDWLPRVREQAGESSSYAASYFILIVKSISCGNQTP